MQIRLAPAEVEVRRHESGKQGERSLRRDGEGDARDGHYAAGVAPIHKAPQRAAKKEASTVDGVDVNKRYCQWAQQQKLVWGDDDA